MPIYKGDELVKAIYKGDTPVSKVLKGEDLVFIMKPTVNAVLRGKKLATTTSTSNTVKYWTVDNTTTTPSGSIPYPEAAGDFEIQIPDGTYKIIMLNQDSQYGSNSFIEEIYELPDGLTDVKRLFQDFSKLTHVNMEGYDMSQVTALDDMFYKCVKITNLYDDIQGIEGWDTSNVTSLSEVFYFMSALEGDNNSLTVPAWDTSNVTNFYEALANIPNIHSIDLTPWDFTSAAYLWFMLAFNPDLTHIKCSQWVKDALLYSFGMTSSASNPTWEIVDVPPVTNRLNIAFNDSATESNRKLIVDGETITLPQYSSTVIPEGTEEISLPSMNGYIRYVTRFPSVKLKSCKKLFYGGYTTSNAVIDIRGIDTSECTNMESMFHSIKKAQIIGLNEMDTSNVTNMMYIFYSTITYSGEDWPDRYISEIANWDVGNVQNMYGIFYLCDGLIDVDLSGWDTHSLNTTTSLFGKCTRLKTVNLSGWDTSHVYNAGEMFNGCSALTDLYLDNFDLTHITSTYYAANIFKDCTSLNHIRCKKDFRDWCWANQENIKLPDAMREGGAGNWELIDQPWVIGTTAEPSQTVTYNINGTQYTAQSDDEGVLGILPDVGDVESLYGMFMGGSNAETVKTLGLQNMKYKADKATSVEKAFANLEAAESIDISNWTLPSVTSLQGLFMSCQSLSSVNVSNLDTANVTDMSDMFSGCSGLTELDLSNFNSGNLAVVSSMFQNCSSLTSLTFGEKWEAISSDNADDIADMFAGCSSLNYIKCTQEFKDWCIQNQDTIGLPDAMREDGDGTWDVIIFNMIGAFSESGSSSMWNFNNNGSTKINIPVDPVTKKFKYIYDGVTLGPSLQSAFQYTSTLISITAMPVTSNVTTVYRMFGSCTGLTEFAGDCWDTSNVTDMSSMFSGCSGLVTVDMSEFVTDSLTTTNYMFNNCKALTTLYVDKFDMSNVTSMTDMFAFCKNLNYIRCKQAFKDWCLSHATDIALPEAMQEDGDGTWEIIP